MIELLRDDRGSCRLEMAIEIDDRFYRHILDTIDLIFFLVLSTPLSSLALSFKLFGPLYLISGNVSMSLLAPLLEP